MQVNQAAKQQNSMQAMLAFALLWRWEGEAVAGGGADGKQQSALGMTSEELDCACEAWLKEEVG